MGCFELGTEDLMVLIEDLIRQQNEIVNKFFIRNSDEILNLFCENNTHLTWADIEGNLILYINSRTEVPGIETDNTIQQNIVRMNASLSFQ